MLKQYVFLPKKMATGKACSQVAHATLLALNKYKKLKNMNIMNIFNDDFVNVIFQMLQLYLSNFVLNFSKNYKYLFYLRFLHIQLY